MNKIENALDIKNDTPIAIIGGSGVYNIKGVQVVEEFNLETPFGYPSDKISKLKLNDVEFLFLARHNKKHNILPNEINYRANIFGLKSLGAQYLISVSAVGSLKEELPPTTFVLVDQFIDWTKGGRKRSFFGDGIVGHVSTADAVNSNLQQMIAQCCKETNLLYKKNGTYLCIEGPQFSSKAESNLYRGFGASVIGMTNVPESYLAKEADLAFATIAMVTDYDCWKDENCNVNDIMETMKTNNLNFQTLFSKLLPILNSNQFDFKKEVAGSIMTSRDLISEQQKEIINILTR